MAAAPSPPAQQSEASPRLSFGPFVLDRLGARLLRDGTAVDVAPKTLAVLDLLAMRPGELVSKDELLDQVWGHRFVSDSALKVAINGLRAALGDDAREPRWVHTVSRRGYRFASDVQVQAAASVAPMALPETGTATAPDPGPSVASAAAPATPGNLPHLNTPLLGRTEDQARLHSAMAGHRLVTITGPSGVGKTRLVLASAGHRAPADGVWLLRLDALGAQDPVIPALARLLGLADGAAADADSLARALAPLQLRLVLDNAEHLADALAPQVSVWLQQAPLLQVVVTSQRPLHVAGEQVLPLTPLALPEAGTGLAAIRQSPAVALLRQRIEAAQPEWTPQDDAQWDDLAEIARALDGMPLALELAAARVPLLGLAGVRQRLGERLRMLTRGAAGATGRHQTLRAALEWSVGLLPAQAAAVLELCAVFAGGFTLDAVQAVAAQTLPELDEWALIDQLDLLREMALVIDAGTPSTPLVPTRGSAQAAFITMDWFAAPRLRLYDSVRLLALERLAAAGGTAAAHSAHLHWLCASLNQAEQVQLDLAEAVWLGKVEPEVANLMAGMSRALGAAQAEQAEGAGAHVHLERAVDLFSASVPLALRSGIRHQVHAWWLALQPLLQPLGQPQMQAEAPGAAPHLPPLLQARLDMAHAMLASNSLVNRAEGVESVRRAAPVLRAHGQTRRLLLALYLGSLMQMLDATTEEAERGLAEMRDLVGPKATVYERRLVPWVEAALARRRGDLEAFGRFYADMLAESERRGDRLEAWKAGWGSAQALYLSGRLEQAAQVFDRTVDDLRRAGRVRAYSLLVGQAACIRLCCDASPQTLQRAHEAVQLLRPSQQVSYSLGDGLPWAAWWQGRVQDALRLHAWSLEMVRMRSEQRGPVCEQMRAALLAKFDGLAIPAESGLDDETAVQLALGLQ